jgi:cobalamin biosynthesis protein CobT
MSDNNKNIGIGMDILRELANTANLIQNSSDGSEKTIEVRFAQSTSSSDNKNNIVIDASKFIANDGKKVEQVEKAMLEEKGRILAKQEMLRSKTSKEKMAVTGFTSQTGNMVSKTGISIFNGILTKNSFDKVKEKWTGFTPEVEAFQTSISCEKQVNQKTHMTDKIDAIMEKWTLPQSEVDFGDTGIEEHWDEFKEILDHVADDFKTNHSPDGYERLEVAEKIYRTIKDKIIEVEEEEKPPAPTPPEDENEDGDDEDGDGKGGSGGEDGDDEDGDGEDGEKEDGEKEGKGNASKTPAERLSDSPVSDWSEALVQLAKLSSGDEKPEEVKLNEPEAKEGDPCKVKYQVKNARLKPNTKDAYRDFLIKNRRAIEAIKQSFAFKSVKLARPDFGKTLGDLDTNGLHKFHMGEKVRLFETKEVPKGKQYTIGLLLDQSGSMMGTKIKDARTVCLQLVEAIKGIKGIDLVVYGHTADAGSMANVVDMFPYYGKGFDNTKNLAIADGIANNADGFAVRFISQKMLETNPANANSIHHLFVISDGQPSANCYAGSLGVNHTRDCVKEAKDAGIGVFGIGIANAFGNSIGDKLYGAGNWVTLADTLSSLPLLCRAIKKLVTK